MSPMTYKQQMTNLETETSTTTTAANVSYYQHSNRYGRIITNTIAIILVIWLATPPSSDALRCYTCSYTDSSSGKSCLMNVTQAQITNCNKKYCTIVRQEAVQMGKKVLSFNRDCQDEPLFPNSVKEDYTYKTYYYHVCSTDLCNDADGLILTNVNTNVNAAHMDNQVIKGKSGVHHSNRRIGANILCLTVLMQFIVSVIVVS